MSMILQLSVNVEKDDVKKACKIVNKYGDATWSHCYNDEHSRIVTVAAVSDLAISCIRELLENKHKISMSKITILT